MNLARGRRQCVPRDVSPSWTWCLIESRRRHNLAATFSPELADSDYLRDRFPPRRQDPVEFGPGITRSDLLVSTRLTSPLMSAHAGEMDIDSRPVRGERLRH